MYKLFYYEKYFQNLKLVELCILTRFEKINMTAYTLVQTYAIYARARELWKQKNRCRLFETPFPHQ